MFVSKLVPQNLNKQRVDIILKELNLVESRTQALALVMAGNVFVDNKKINKPGKLINSNTTIKLKKNDHNWVSRGGIKLNYAFKKFDINVYEKISLDIGCSTGGFTDVLLYAGAKKVYAVDVGYGQFDWKLRNSDKVTLLERTNASIPFFLHASPSASGELNWGYPLNGFPAKVTSRFAMVKSASLISSFMYLNTFS